GLRHGDPISPYLFTLVMEVFSLLLAKNVQNAKNFKYHYGCKTLKLTNMCFADDLLVLCNGDIEFVSVIKKKLDQFSSISGLAPNAGKNTIFFGSVLIENQKDILKMLPLQVNSVKLKGISISEIKPAHGDSCGWKKLLDLRSKIKNHVIYSVRNGKKAYMWFNRWDIKGPLADIIPRRVWCEKRYTDNEKVGDMIERGVWIWPARCGTKKIKFMKAQKKVSPDGGPINMGGPLMCRRPKANMGPPPGTTPGSEKSRGIKKKGLYVMKLRNKPKEKICLATIDENSMLWHRRLSHANIRLIQSLASKGLVRNLPKLKFDQHFCDACKIGKQAHASHRAKNIVSTTRCLELLHMDLFGPFAVLSYGGNRYTLVILDDYSRNGIVSRNKARLVAQGYNQQEGIDYDETYTPVATLEPIRILLAYACALDFKLFQMDVKSAFLNGFINEEVFIAQPSGFIDFEKPDHVYKLKKALYGLKQAPKAWYDRLKAFLIKHEYKMRKVDNTLFTKKKSSNLIIVEIYVDNIIFGSTCQDMCEDFANIMHDEFEMSMIGELNFFLGLQIKQMKDGIFFNKSKYIKEMLKKFGLEESKPIKTPMSIDTKLTKDKKYRKSTSGICTFLGCCLTSWFSKKQTALAISTIEAEYISAGKTC
nr:copia protein [Tanacetum cinerariifolium]